MQRSITAVNDDLICKIISEANERVLFLAPAIRVKVAQIICKKWKELGRHNVNVILDLDPEVFRLGYGEIEALNLVETTAKDLGGMIQRQPGARIGLIVADHRTLIFAPAPALIEAGPSSESSPNGVVLDSTPTSIERELGHGVDGVKSQVIGLDKATCSDIANIETDLKQNPPQRFDIARTVRVFNAHFEFVEFEMTGTHLGRKTLSIPPELMGLANDEQTKNRLKANYRIIDERDALSGSRLQKAKAWLINTYLSVLPGYGSVVLRSVKPEFERKVKQLERCVDLFKKSIRRDLEKAMAINRKTLVDALLPSVLASPPAKWRKHYGTTPTKDAIQRLLEQEIGKASGTPESIARDIRVKVVFKGVTYQLLTDDAFMKLAREALPTLPELHTEYDAAQAKEPKPRSLFDQQN